MLKVLRNYFTKGSTRERVPFKPSDGGVHTFTNQIVFKNRGNQTLTVANNQNKNKATLIGSLVILVADAKGGQDIFGVVGSNVYVLNPSTGTVSSYSGVNNSGSLGLVADARGGQ